MTETFPKLMSGTKPQIQEAQWTPSVIKADKKKKTPKTPTIPQHFIFKLQKIKEKK